MNAKFMNMHAKMLRSKCVCARASYYFCWQYETNWRSGFSKAASLISAHLLANVLQGSVCLPLLLSWRS